jgi:glutathione S-transferase
MKLHYGMLSSSSRRVTIAAKLLGIELDLVPVDLRDPANRAALTKLNPNTKVPVLEDGDFVLWESVAIMQYLCERTPGQTLYPSEPRARADVNRWLSWAQAHWSPAIGGLGWEHVWKKLVTGADADPDQVKRHETFFAQFATVLDAHLAKPSGGTSPAWLVGDHISLADIAIATPLMMTRLARIPLRSYANVTAWFGRIQELPAWQQTEAPQLEALEAQLNRTAL